MNIYQRMSAITSELATVAKNLEVETGKDKNGKVKSYKAVSERDIIDAVKPLEVKHGVYSYPADRTIIESEMLEEESQYGKRTKFYLKLQTVYRFVNMEKPEEYIDIISFSTGLDSGDKAEGKAMTYGDKYALMKAYKISTGDDPDAKASEDSVYTKTGTSKPIKLASDASRKTIMDLCNMMKLDWAEILLQTGWRDGDKLTQDQADSALLIIQKISHERESNK